MSQNRVTLDYIGKAVDEFIHFFGIKEDANLAMLKHLLESSRTADCVETLERLCSRL